MFSRLDIKIVYNFLSKTVRLGCQLSNLSKYKAYKQDKKIGKKSSMTPFHLKRTY